MVYGLKQKMKLFRELHHPRYLEADLALLKSLDPANSLLRLNPAFLKRKTDALLYALLDLTTSENIRLNRRKYESRESNRKTTGLQDTPQPGETTAPENPGENNFSQGTTSDIDGKDAEAKEELEDLQERVNGLESENENLLNQNEALQEQNEMLQNELDDTKEELETEKKSTPTSGGKSKKKKNTRTSAGRKSSTKTSKSQR